MKQVFHHEPNSRRMIDVKDIAPHYSNIKIVLPAWILGEFLEPLFDETSCHVPQFMALRLSNNTSVGNNAWYFQSMGNRKGNEITCFIYSKMIKHLKRDVGDLFELLLLLLISDTKTKTRQKQILVEIRLEIVRITSWILFCCQSDH